MNGHGGNAENALEDFMFFFYRSTETNKSAEIASLQRIINQKKANSLFVMPILVQPFH
jgi:hypothetical protein